MGDFAGRLPPTPSHVRSFITCIINRNSINRERSYGRLLYTPMLTKRFSNASTDARSLVEHVSARKWLDRLDQLSGRIAGTCGYRMADRKAMPLSSIGLLPSIGYSGDIRYPDTCHQCLTCTQYFRKCKTTLNISAFRSREPDLKS